MTQACAPIEKRPHAAQVVEGPGLSADMLCGLEAATDSVQPKRGKERPAACAVRWARGAMHCISESRNRPVPAQRSAVEGGC